MNASGSNAVKGRTGETSMRWYYEKNNQRVGPVTDADIERLAGEGTIAPDTRVWNEAIAQWMPYGHVAGGSAAQPAAAPAMSSAGAQAACSQCGRMLPADDLIVYQGLNICAACKPVFFQKVKEGAALPGTMAYAGFWIRVGAYIIDQILLYVVNLIITLVLGAVAGLAVRAGQEPTAQLAASLIVILLQIVVAAAYATFFVGKYGATPGKMAVGIMVVMSDGEGVSYGRALGRYFATILSGLILGIGYLMIAFDDEKRALHDRICDTRVIKKAR